MQLERRLVGHYLQVLEHKLERHEQFIDSVSQLVKEYQMSLIKEPSDFLATTIRFREALQPLLEKQHRTRQTPSFDEEFTDFNSQVEQYVSFLEPLRIREQDPERFAAQSGDSFILKRRKQFKSLFYRLSQLPVKAGNFFRKRFKSIEKPVKPWFHAVPLQQLCLFYFRDEMGSALLPLYTDLQKFLALNELQLRKLTAKANLALSEERPEVNELPDMTQLEAGFAGLKEASKTFNEDLGQKVKKAIDDVFKTFQSDYKRVNTLELSGKKFAAGKQEKKHAELNEQYRRTNEGWHNTRLALFEAWRLEEERMRLQYGLQESLLEAKNELTKRIEGNIIPPLQQISKSLKQSEERVSSFSGDRIALKAIFITERRNALKELRREKIPLAIEAVLEQQLAAVVDKLEVGLEDRVALLPDRSILLKSNSYDRETRSGELHNFSFHELISHDNLPVFKDLLRHTKSKLVQDLDRVQRSLGEVDSVADFNLESALAMLEKEEKTVEESIVVAREGLQRAVARAQAIETEMLGVEEEVIANLEEAVGAFLKQLAALDKLENVYEVQLRIAKAKALKRGKEYRARLLSTIKNTIPVVMNYTLKTGKQSLTYYRNLKHKYGLSQAPSLVAAEISDYLAEVQSAIALLPFVYQRLFDVAPLTDGNFYEERTKEMTLLVKAYQNWDKGYFATTVIVGEKGAGATTLINFFIKDLYTPYKVIRIEDFEDCPDEEHLVKILGKGFKNNDLNSLEETVDYINGLQEKYIITIENLQRLYLRKVGGFETLKMLLRLMSNTNKKVFWITSCTSYTWNYLNKALNIGDYFGYINYLEGLKDEQIIQVILKRHRVSGYNIYFEATPVDRHSRKYKKLTADEKQEYLKVRFFESLNKFARNNLSLALIYWLRSTKKVTGDTISIGSMSGISFSFLGALSNDKLTILHALLLHDVLSDKSMALILSKDYESCKMLLLLMFDDGIIVKEKEKYRINPLLYRQTVNLLMSKNFLH